MATTCDECGRPVEEVGPLQTVPRVTMKAGRPTPTGVTTRYCPACLAAARR